MAKSNKQNLKIGIAAGCFIVALVIVVNFVGGGDDVQPARDTEWYYDIDSKELFEAETSQNPPVTAPSGANKGVKAFVFACDVKDCSDSSKRFVGYLFKYADGVKDFLDDRSRVDEIMKGTLVRGVDETDWVTLTDEAQTKYDTAAMTKCGGKSAAVCMP